MQKFDFSLHQKFINYFQIKENHSEIDNFLFNKTYKYIKFIKWIPWIKFIWIWNSLSMFASKKTSDIDLFIITSQNRMWLVRILLTFIFSILQVRKTKNKHSTRFCLSFFCTEKSIDFSDFALKNDIYLYFWIIYLKPILNFDNTYLNFIKSQSWADFEWYENIINENKKFVKYAGNSFWNNSLILDLIDKFLKKIFFPFTLKHYQKLNKPYWIIINENMLKFHDNDKRKEIQKKLF